MTAAERLKQLVHDLSHDPRTDIPEVAAAAQEEADMLIEEIESSLQRAIFLAQHLFQMIDPQTWRDSGADDMQGHYEGDYHAESVRRELEGLAKGRLDGVDRLPYLRLREQAIELANAADDVDEHIMSNGLAFKRERMRWFVGKVRDVIEREDNRDRART